MKSTAAVSIVAILVVIFQLKCNANKTELFIASLHRSLRDNGAAGLGINLAVDAAKNSSVLKDFLDKYEIRIQFYSTNYKPSKAVFISTYVLSYRTGGYALLLLGPQTAPEASSVLNTIRFYRKLMVTYLTTTSDVVETLDPFGFTFAPGVFTFNKAIIKMIEHFNWKRVAIVYDSLETGGLYTKAADNLIMNADFTIIGHEAIYTGLGRIGEDNQDKIKKLKDLDAKIFFGAFNSRGAKLVFCELFKMNMFGPEYVWILHPDAGTIDTWAFLAEVERRKNKTGTCTKEQYQKVVARNFILDKHISYRKDENATTDSGLSLRQVLNMPDVIDLYHSQKIEMATAFDTMWAIMLALKEASAVLPNSLPLENNVKRFIGSSTITRTIESKLRNVSFEGLTGPISFTSNEEREGIIAIQQFQGDKMVQIGEHNTKQDKFVLYDDTKDTLWKDGQPPLDHSKRELRFMKISVPLIIAMWLFAAIGMICSLGFLYFNIRNRENRIIKMSSPNLNNIIVLGCILCYVSVILFGLDARFLNLEEYSNICNARSAVLSIGYSLSLGAMFSKTWRVNKIFTAGASLKKMAIKDLHLLVIVAGLLIVDVVFLSCWNAIDPLQAEILAFEERIRQEHHIIIIPALYQCTCTYKTYFLGVVFTYKGLLLLFGLFLTWETRNVTIPALNDSKYIGMSVYNVFVLYIIGSVAYLALEGSVYHEASYAVLSMCLIVCTTVTLLLVFVPKIYQFYTKDEAATQRIPAVNLMEGQISQFNCKATQTDCDVPECAANEALPLSDEILHEIPMVEEQVDENMAVALNPHTCEVVIKKCDAAEASTSP